MEGSGNPPRRRHVIEALRADVLGRKVGERLPSVDEYIEQLGTTERRVREAVHTLQREGLIERRGGHLYSAAGEPGVQRVLRELREDVERRTPGERLPKVDDLCRELRTTVRILRRAIKTLMREGVIEQRGRAYHVAAAEPERERVFRLVKHEVEARKGEKLPPLRDLARGFGTTRTWVEQAIERLQPTGKVTRRGRFFYAVGEPEPERVLRDLLAYVVARDTGAELPSADELTGRYRTTRGELRQAIEILKKARVLIERHGGILRKADVSLDDLTILRLLIETVAHGSASPATDRAVRLAVALGAERLTAGIGTLQLVLEMLERGERELHEARLLASGRTQVDRVALRGALAILQAAGRIRPAGDPPETDPGRWLVIPRWSPGPGAVPPELRLAARAESDLDRASRVLGVHRNVLRAFAYRVLADGIGWRAEQPPSPELAGYRVVHGGGEVSGRSLRLKWRGPLIEDPRPPIVVGFDITLVGGIDRKLITIYHIRLDPRPR